MRELRTAFLFALAFLAGFSALPALAASQDVGIKEATLSVPADSLIAGQEVRIYATVENLGDVDMSAIIGFYRGVNLLGDPARITAKAHDFPEQAWADFIVPAGSFNVRIQIEDTSPTDHNDDNDTFLTGSFIGRKDADSDGYDDDADNCPLVSNPAQQDTDSDGQGNECDDDDDGDGIPDADEASLGTSSVRADTDSDGVGDKDDNCPVISNRDQADADEDGIGDVCDVDMVGPADLEEEEEDPAPAEEELPSDLPTIDLEEFNPDLLEEVTEEWNSVTSSIFAEDIVIPLINYERSGWKSFSFSADSPAPERAEVFYRWKFSEGGFADGKEVSHKFPGAGLYSVELTLADEGGNFAKDILEVQIGFLDYRNPYMWLFVALIIAASSWAVTYLFRHEGKKKVDRTPKEG